MQEPSLSRSQWNCFTTSAGWFSHAPLPAAAGLAYPFCRSWQKGINRVAIWAYENMYSEEKAYEYFRFRKEDIPVLLTALRIPTAVCGRVKVGNRYKFAPMEMLCTFLWRMSYPGTWARALIVLGGRCESAYKQAFYWMLQYLYRNYKRCVDDISRWGGNCAEWADAIHQSGAPAPR